MRYERGETLGLFCGELGIRPSARVAIAPFSNGLRIWDLSTGTEFVLNIQRNALHTRPRAVPARCISVFAESDQVLLARFANPRFLSWSRERETIASELRYRKLDHGSHKHPRASMPLLLLHWVHRFRPVHTRRSASIHSSLCN